MRLGQVFTLCFVLVAIALGLFSYKAGVLNYPVLPNEEAQSWRVEAKIKFYPEYKKPIQVHLFKPQPTEHVAIVDESIVANDYGLIEKVGKTTNNKSVTLTRRQARGQQLLFFQAVFYEVTSSNISAAKVVPPKAMPVYVPRVEGQQDNAEVTPLDTAMTGLIQEARDKSADNISLATEIVRLLKRPNDDRVTVLQMNLPDSPTFAAQVSNMVNAAEVPARVVNGIILKEHTRNVPLVQWIEVFADGKWQAIDVDTGKIGVGDNYVPWWRGTKKLVSVDGGQNVTTEISIKYNREDAITQAQWKSKQASNWISALSLFDLPIDTQIMFGIVLMIPIGALVIVLLRQIIGVPTFGTFMPVLIALSFRETGLLWGIGLFGTIVMIGIYLRAYFDQLRLLVVPRLASVLTIVVLLIAAMTVITYKLGINAGLSITLFPMIILTMMIERMALMTEEFGGKEARKTAYGSIFAASLAYFAMHGVLVNHLIFVFPELLLIVLACTILLGRYNGYKLSEYMRFKKLAKAILAAEERAKNDASNNGAK
jgi:7 transmembrane helices usually fused to an inactive transglutaminase/Inactive transglutaminase fused to 7 transmembrane helices